MANLEIRKFAKICFILILLCNYVFTQENVEKKCSYEGDEEQLNYFDETNLRSSKVENGTLIFSISELHFSEYSVFIFVRIHCCVQEVYATWRA